MAVFTVGLLQMTSAGFDHAANLDKGDAFCRRAKAKGADLALFPEMWSIGYSGFPAKANDWNLWRAPELWGPDDPPVSPIPPGVRAYWRDLAIDGDGPWVTHFRRLAVELEMAIAITYLESWDGAPRNVVSLIDRTGEMVFTYAKVHTCDFSAPEASTTPGDAFFVGTLETAAGPVRIGAMICYDREFPESARILMLQGAEVILTPNACHLESSRLAQFRTRAYENMLGVAMANYAAPEHNGHSVAFDPSAFDSEGHPRETLIVEAGETEGVFLAPFDLDALRDFRLREPWGNAFRRPHRYGELCAPGVQPPFVRVNACHQPYIPTRR